MHDEIERECHGFAICTQDCDTIRKGNNTTGAISHCPSYQSLRPTFVSLTLELEADKTSVVLS